MILSDEHKAEDGFDVHQIRCSYYSVLDGDDDAYLAARALQFFTPGVPQVYYVGLLAGENDLENVKNRGRAGNQPPQFYPWGNRTGFGKSSGSEIVEIDPVSQ